MANLTIRRQTRTHRRFIEDLGNGIKLEMVLIPGGTFVMGSPEDELDRFEDESPQHIVRVPTFFMSRYPITQAQWSAVPGFPDLDPALEYVKNPSDFTGEDRPVDNVTWYEATRFCQRLQQHTYQLSQNTKRIYRLPSEAEWEYACRGVTFPATSLLNQTDSTEQEIIKEWNQEYHQPFYFGETIMAEVANYDASVVYGQGREGKPRQETTQVTAFDNAANPLGLCDLHGNVLEWCQDDYHDSYEGALADGSAWVDDKNTTKILRGGSWFLNPRSCRSAFRGSHFPDLRDDFIGFRVVCGLRGL